MAKCTMNVLSARGHTAVVWDPKKVEQGDPDATAAIQEAERIFEEHRAAGATAFRIGDDGEPQVITVFDPTAEQITVIPRVTGG